MVKYKEGEKITYKTGGNTRDKTGKKKKKPAVEQDDKKEETQEVINYGFEK